MPESVNPFTGKRIRSWEPSTDEEIQKVIEDSHSAWHRWCGIDIGYRGKRFLKLAHILEDSKNQLAVQMALEMGKPVNQGRAEIEKCAWVCRYYAENSQDFLEDLPIETDAAESYVTYQPLGIIYAVMPWNFPYWQLFRFAAPAVMAGNAFILKHSPNVTGAAVRIGELFTEAGFPGGLAGVIRVSAEDTADVSRRILSDKRIAAVTLTGSGRAGASLASAAGSEIKKCVLELGGSDPAIILEDADLEQAADAAVFSRLINSGQNCIASKRFIVHQSVYDSFLELVLERMKARRMGDPLNEKTDLGPLARFDLRDQLHRQVTESIDMGARLVLGGSVPDHQGAFYPATVLTECSSGMPVFDQETFGPVAALCSFRDETEAIAIANDTDFGLGASIFTRNPRRGERIALDLRAGACFVNTFVRSDPRLPFGGIGISGFGRELSRVGQLEFMNCKTVYISGGS